MKRVKGSSPEGLSFEMLINPGSAVRLVPTAGIDRRLLADHVAGIAVALGRDMNRRSLEHYLSITWEALAQVTAHWRFEVFDGEKGQQGMFEVLLHGADPPRCLYEQKGGIADSSIVGLIKGLVAFASEQGVKMTCYAMAKTDVPGLATK